MKTRDGKEVVEFGMESKGATREERVLEYELNWRKAQTASEAGKVICISDLMCQAEQLHMEPVRKTSRQTKIEKMVAAIKKEQVV